MNAMLVCSPGARSPPSGISTPFEAGTLSPVKRRLVDLQRARLDDPPVRGHLVAGSKQDKIADDDLLGVDLGLGAVTPDARRRLDHRLERVHRALRLALLAQANDRVDHVITIRSTPVLHSLIASETIAAPTRISCM